MIFINFRNCDSGTRLKMKLRNAPALQKLEDAEIRASGGIWVRKEDFPGCLDHLPSERPTGAGTMFRF